MLTLSERTAESFRHLLQQGMEGAEAIRALAELHQLPIRAIRRRLRRVGVITPTKRESPHPQNVGPMSPDDIARRRVYRDPCPRCGQNPERGDCGHRRGRKLSGWVFAA